MELAKFIEVTEDLERRQLNEGIFWQTRAGLGDDFLCKGLDLDKISYYFHKFLSVWRSYRREIDWRKLVDSWESKQQKVSAEIINSNLEDASDNELSGAAGLFNHLLESSITGLGTTNISKLLALGLPSICMMWDRGIMNEFKDRYPSRPGSGIKMFTTYHLFMLQRRLELQDLIGQAQATNNQTREQAVVWLRELPRRVNSWSREKPLAKLIDEFYYWNSRKP